MLRPFTRGASITRFEDRSYCDRSPAHDGPLTALTSLIKRGTGDQPGSHSTSCVSHTRRD